MFNHNYTETRKEEFDEAKIENNLLPTVDLSVRDTKHFPYMDFAKPDSLNTGVGQHSSGRHRKKHNGCNCCDILFSSTETNATGRRHVFVSRVQDDSRTLQVDAYSEKTISNTSISPVSNASPDSSSAELHSTKTDFKTLLFMFLERSSIYALNQIGSSASRRRKFFWAMIMIVGLIGSFIQIVQFLSSYFAYPVVVNIDSISQLNMEFPSVTVCNINNVQKEFLPCMKEGYQHYECNTSAFSKDYNLDLDFTDDLDGTECATQFGNITPSRTDQFLWRNLFALQNEQNQMVYGHQASDFIISCSFNGEKCDHDDFYHFVNSEYGNCFTFNTVFHNNNTLLTTSFIGPNGGLELELDIEVDKYAHYTRAIGARVQVHDPKQVADVIQRGINVSPGFETSITLKRNIMERLQKPYKDECKYYQVGDSMQFCYDRCMETRISHQCGCFREKNLFKAKRCDFSKRSNLCCVFAIKDFVTECECPLSCEDTDYLINTFNAVWPSDAYLEENPISKTGQTYSMTMNQVRETRLKVKVYYDTLETTIYRQNAKYQNSELFSQIGGQMGLWLGLSLIAFFECVENFFLLWQYRTKQNAHRQ